MVRIVTLNLNGIRSAARKGWLEWAAHQHADVICVQEIRAQDADLTERLRAFADLTGYFAFAQRKGYSGVGIYARRAPRSLRAGIGCDEFDPEGRYLEADFGAFTAVSMYLPSGSSGELRQQAKRRFMQRAQPHLARLRTCGREIVLCGDLNIAHREIDLKNWRANQKNSGFLPDERAWLTHLFDEVGWVDVFRRLDPSPERYTWWSNRGQAWAKNVGWRLDYHLATPGIAARAVRAQIYTEARFSDHAPVTVDYALGATTGPPADAVERAGQAG